MRHPLVPAALNDDPLSVFMQKHTQLGMSIRE